MNDLVLVPALSAERNERGEIIVTRSFFDELDAWRQHWNGGLRVLMASTTPPPTDREPAAERTDRVAVERGDFDITVLNPRAPAIVPRLQGAAVVLADADERHTRLPLACRQAGVPFVYATAQTLRSRLRRIRSSGARWRRAPRAYQAWTLEQRHQRVIRGCAGLHCNGTPTFNAYQGFNPKALLYFESRVRRANVIDPDTLEARLARLQRYEPLRLVGRLERSRGGDPLVPLAQKLRERGVPFHFSICGDGPATAGLQRQVRRLGLGRQVALRGDLRFETGLVPFLQRDADLFVCCHSDDGPPPAYAETLACGVPIVGYDNEAFAGLLERVDIGRAAPTGNADALADLVLRLSMHRDPLERWAYQAMAFGAEHTFEASFARRGDHLRGIAAHPSAASRSERIVRLDPPREEG